jgi:hypothetical protein
MFRALSVCALLLTLPLLCRADDKPEPTETVIRLKVQPAPAPKPAMRYQLLPELRELNPGNPAQAYLMCFPEQNNFFFRKDALENRQKWETMPLKELPLKELYEFGYGKVKGGPLGRADYAARLETVDWQVLLKLKQDGIKFLLPEVQQLRLLGSCLKVRLRVEVAERRFDDALVTAKTMFALAHHLEDHPTAISGLVGEAIAFLAISPLDEMLEQPGCPNLYWALTALPKPLVNFRKGLQTERMVLASVFDVLDETAPMTEAQLQTAVERIREMITDTNGLPWLKEDVGKWLASRVKDEARVRASRRRLVDNGLAEDTVKKFPPLQVVLLDDKLATEIWRDDEFKAMPLPYWEAEPFLMNRKPPRGTEEESLFIGLTSDFRKLRQTEARLAQRFALLTCVEALRMHAAEHDGKLPTQLADVKVPLPVDSVTGKPFIYKLDGDTATLHGTPPKGMEKNAAYNVRYEVTIGK